MRGSVLDCGSLLPLCVASPAVEKRQGTAAVQNLAEYFLGSFQNTATALLKPLQTVAKIFLRHGHSA